MADPYYLQSLVILPFDGTNGSTTWTDYSVSPVTMVSGAGAPVISTAQSKSGGSSLYLSGTTYLRTSAATNAFSFTNSSVATIECWAYVTATPATFATIADSSSSYGSNNYNWMLLLDSARKVSMYVGDAASTTQLVCTTTPAVTLNTWTHIAVVKNGTSVKIYLDGVQQASGTISITMALRATADRYFTIGAGHSYPDSYKFQGYIDNFRIVSGAAVYTGTFTPPTSLDISPPYYKPIIVYAGLKREMPNGCYVPITAGGTGGTTAAAARTALGAASLDDVFDHIIQFGN